MTGLTRVTSIVPRAGPERVYNMEVHGEHVYRVGLKGVLVHNSYAQGKRRKLSGAITEPNLPPKTIAEGGGVRIVHYTRSGDHGPAHLHVSGRGADTRIGQNGRPLSGDPTLSAKQQELVDSNRGAIRRAVDQIMRFHRFERVGQ